MKLPYGFNLLVDYFRRFRKHIGNRIYLIIVLTVATGWAEGLGIALFYPLFNQSGQVGNDPLSRTLASIFHFLHVPMTPLGALPLILILFLSKAGLSFATSVVQLFSMTRFVRVSRSRIVEELDQTDYRHLIGNNAGFYANLLTNETSRAAAGYLYFARAIPPGINALVFVLIVLKLDWRLTGACLAIGVITILILRITGRISRVYSEATTRENGIITHLLIQTLHAFKYLRATAGFASFRRKIDRSADLLAHADYRSGFAWAISQSISPPIMMLFVVGIMYYRVAVWHESLASLFVLLAYFMRISTELFTLQSHWQTFSSMVGSIDAIDNALDALSQHRETRGTRPLPAWEQSVKAEQLSFAYQADKPVLRQIDLVIPKASTVAFVGESGSGKSTLADVLTGTLTPSAGRVLLDGENLAELDIEAFRKSIGYVPQDSIVFDDTVANNITLWADAPPDKIASAARRARCLEFIQAMPNGFESQIGERGVRLSGGQRQRLAIARELFKSPAVLVLDEATSALDSESERAIQQSIDALKGQMTILIIAHRLSTIRNCDHIYVLHEGRIVEDGTYDELLARPGSRFQRMCELQNLLEGNQLTLR